MNFRLVFLALIALFATACATGPGPSPDEEPSAYGAFLAARYAGAQDDLSQATEYYAVALEQSPGDVLLTDRAFFSAILAGELEQATQFARQSVAAGDESRLATLYLAADRIAERRPSQALSVLDSAPDYGPFNTFLADVLRHWALAGSGEIDAALQAAQDTYAPGYLAGHMALHRALLFEHAGLAAEAEGAYRVALQSSALKRLITAAYGAFVERRGRPDQAAFLYRRYLGDFGEDASIRAALQRAESGERAPRRPTLAQSAALSVFGPAAALAQEADMELSVIYLRMVERLDPDLAELHLVMGQSLENIQFRELALAQYAAIEAGPFLSEARAARIMLIARMGRMGEAASLAAQAAEEHGDEDSVILLADLLRLQGRCEDAAGLYAAVLAAQEAGGELRNWARYLEYGNCLMRLDRIEEAESAFRTGLTIAPDAPQLLNALAGALLERSGSLDEALDLSARAVSAAPQSSDYLATRARVRFAAEDYDTAVSDFETAAVLEPASALLNAWLGDAYWRVGRRLEAEFQWRRALQLSPEGEVARLLEARLAEGLPEAGAEETAAGSATESGTAALTPAES